MDDNSTGNIVGDNRKDHMMEGKMVDDSIKNNIVNESTNGSYMKGTVDDSRKDSMMIDILVIIAALLMFVART